MRCGGVGWYGRSMASNTYTQPATGETEQEALEENHFLFITTIHTPEFALVSERHCVGKEV